ncbi:MAG: response regulator [Nitrospirales bacterium]|nr:response regulator [Nitrospirales bacterium]
MTKKELLVLLVEDDPGDVQLTREAFETSRFSVSLCAVSNGVEAMKYLRCESPYERVGKPDLVLLDLNMPKKGGRDVLREMKSDEDLRSIPVVVLTTSQAEADIHNSYYLGANCYVTKPVGFTEFTRTLKAVEEFWFSVAKLPPRDLPCKEGSQPE